VTGWLAQDGRQLRLPPLRDASGLTDAGREAHDYIIATRGSIPGPSGVLLRAPALARAFSDLCGVLRSGETAVEKTLLELAICLVAVHTGNEVIWASHSRLALKAGANPALVESLRSGSASPAVSAREDTLLRFGRAVLDGGLIQDETVREALAVFGEEGVTEITAAIGSYLMAACVIRVAGLQPR